MDRQFRHGPILIDQHTDGQTEMAISTSFYNNPEHVYFIHCIHNFRVVKAKMLVFLISRHIPLTEKVWGGRSQKMYEGERQFEN